MLKHVSSRMAKTVNTLAVPSVSIRHVTDLQGDVFFVVQKQFMGIGVVRVKHFFCIFQNFDEDIKVK